MNFLWHFWQRFWQRFVGHRQSHQYPRLFILEPILTPSHLFSLDWGADDDLVLDHDWAGAIEAISEDLDYLDSDDLEDFELDEYLTFGTEMGEILGDSYPEFAAGVFTVGNTGEIEIDLLFDGGTYRGEIVIFSLAGMDEFELGSEEFIQEAARRGASHSPWGYTVSDRLSKPLIDAPREMGVQPLLMRKGDRFGIMLIPQDTLTAILEDSSLESAPRPLFSLATENPYDGLHFGQITDLTGEGNTFVIEDLRLDRELEGDLIFKVCGATGKAPTMNELIA
ncbi:MAG: DUF4114 domain-containing protein [Spirulina sp.]